MGIFFRIGVSMVHAVHDGIGTWCKVGTPLRYIGQEVKKPLPQFVHGEHFMRGIPMMEKGLEKQGKKPMNGKKDKNRHQ